MNTKAWYQSKTIWAALVAGLAGLASLTGHSVDDQTQAIVANQLASIADAVVILSSVLAAIFRTKATTTIAPPTGNAPGGQP